MGYFKCNNRTIDLSPTNYDYILGHNNISSSRWVNFVKDGGIEYIIENNKQSLFLNKKIILDNSISYIVSGNSINYSDPNYKNMIMIPSGVTPHQFKIAGFNHDNTTNTVDLIMCYGFVDCQYSTQGTYYWGTGMSKYYNKFSNDVKSICVNRVNPSYNSYYKRPSLSDLGCTNKVGGDIPNTSKAYPIFNLAPSTAKESTRIFDIATTSSNVPSMITIECSSNISSGTVGLFEIDNVNLVVRVITEHSIKDKLEIFIIM